MQYSSEQMGDTLQARHCRCVDTAPPVGEDSHLNAHVSAIAHQTQAISPSGQFVGSKTFTSLTRGPGEGSSRTKRFDVALRLGATSAARRSILFREVAICL